MLRKSLLALAGAAIFTFAAGTTSTAKADGPYGYGPRTFGGYGAYRAPSPGFRYPSYGRDYYGPSRYQGRGYRGYYYAPPRGYYGDRYNSYRPGSYYGNRGYGRSGIYLGSPGFSIRIGR
jgi:hypothetical protein